MDTATARPTVFVSYSHQDEARKDRLVKQLRVLELEGDLEVWDDRRIKAGDNWRPEIEQAMARARAAVLLISADFLTSGFIRGTEVPEILRRREREGPLARRWCRRL
jgi:TIR domain